MNVIRIRFREELVQEWNRVDARRKLTVALYSFMAAALLIGILFLTGCAQNGPIITPAAFSAEVGQSVAIGLDVYPAAAPEVKIARDVVCAEVGKTNISPAEITAELSKAGITNSNSKLIVDGALLLYNGVFVLLTTNQTASAQPYLDALCQGLTQGLPAENLSGRERAMARKARNVLPPHLK